MKAEDKSLKAENKILEAALLVVKESTISGTRMHLIAEKADMVQSNLHYYFKTKNDLMFGLQEKVLKKCHEIRKKFKDEADETLESQLGVFINQKINFLLENQEYDYAEIDFWVQCRINDKIKKNFEESFESWRFAVGEMLDQYAPDIPAEKRAYLPHLIVSLLEGATLQYLADETCMDVHGYFNAVKDMVLRTINDARGR